jgi:hypothetical protein
MSRRIALFSSIVACVLLMSVADSQSKIISALVKPDTSAAAVTHTDTLVLKGGAVFPAIPKNAKSGTLAMVLSAVLPGAGQVYAHRYYTIPIIWGFGAFFGSQWVKANDVYRKYSRLFVESVQLDTLSHTGNSYYLDLRDEWHDYRDEFAIYIALTYILNIVDAYVGATLCSFDVSDNLGGSAALQFRIPFH